MTKTLITGVGSILMGDDGIGVKVIDELLKEEIPDNIRLHSGDVSGLDLLKVFPDFDKIIIIDAADMKEEAGCIRVFDFSSIKKSEFNDKFSTHGMALLETLTLADKLDLAKDIKIVGIQPENTDFGLELSELIRGKIPEIIRIVKTLY